MRTVHLLRKYHPAEWGGTETAVQRLFAGLREHEVESIVYCPAIKRMVEKDPLAAAGHRIERFKAFAPILGISSQRRRQIVSVGGNLMSLDLLPRLLREKDVDVIHTHALGRIGGIGRLPAAQCAVGGDHSRRRAGSAGGD
jgi:alpha-maltose-1-phosphate synthase